MTAQAFQTSVKIQPGVAAVGDFADANIRSTVIAPPGGFISDAAHPPIVGNFAWGDQASGVCASRYSGALSAKPGFVHREGETIIVSFLAQQALALQPGLPATLYDQGSFWALFPNGAAVGQKVFANYLDGSVFAAAAGTSTQVWSSSAASLAAATGVLTVGGTITGTVVAGDSALGAGVAPGVVITAQLTGTLGGAGTYQTTYTGGAVASEAMTGNASVETVYFVDTPANAGELAKISTWG